MFWNVLMFVLGFVYFFGGVRNVFSKVHAPVAYVRTTVIMTVFGGVLIGVALVGITGV